MHRNRNRKAAMKMWWIWNRRNDPPPPPSPPSQSSSSSSCAVQMFKCTKCCSYSIIINPFNLPFHYLINNIRIHSNWKLRWWLCGGRVCVSKKTNIFTAARRSKRRLNEKNKILSYSWSVIAYFLIIQFESYDNLANLISIFVLLLLLSLFVILKTYVCAAGAGTAFIDRKFNGAESWLCFTSHTFTFRWGITK